jgi:S-DNA-T family DNA segregation ATPase FtsK/SpoIIIE
LAKTRTRSTGGRKRSAPEPPKGPLGLEPGIVKDIYGICLTALAVAVLIAVLTRSDAPLPGYIATGLGMAFGIGRYLIAAFLFAWGLTFFFDRFDMREWTVGGGLALAFTSIIAMVAMATPAPLEQWWTSANLIDGGGYAGGGVAWLLTRSTGPVIGYVVLIALFLIGMVLATGVTIAETSRRLREMFSLAPEEEEPQLPRRLRPGAKTLPLADLEPSDGFAADAAVSGKLRRGDPESARRTVPTPRMSGPRTTDGFVLPPLTILTVSPQTSATRASDKELRNTAVLIEQTLATFDIPARVTTWVPGPTVTLFKIQLAKGIKVSRVTALSDDVALALAATTVRVLAPIPGEALVGIEVPNDLRSTVTLGDVLIGANISESSPLLLGIGKDVSGDRVIEDLARMPHLLIAGSTGTGKSVCINALLMSLIMRATPAEVRLILIDPKRIELSQFNGIPHLYVPVVTEAKEAASALAWAVTEMEQRLRRLQKASARNIAMYNAMVGEGKAPEGAETMPYIVIVIDELADLMMVAAREVEDSICRLAQLARAAGIHLIVATQRPSTDIITGLIKTNITHRIAFMVGSSIDSRVILDQTGAEKLVGLGDMLLSTPSLNKPKRVQGAFVSEDEINAVVDHLKKQAEPDYHEEILHLKVAPAGGGVAGRDEDDDPLIWEAADIIVMSGVGSTSLLQRRLKVGYARAGRIMDMLEQKGVVGAPDGSKPRDVLVDIEDLESLKAFERADADGGSEE